MTVRNEEEGIVFSTMTTTEKESLKEVEKPKEQQRQERGEDVLKTDVVDEDIVRAVEAAETVILTNVKDLLLSTTTSTTSGSKTTEFEEDDDDMSVMTGMTSCGDFHLEELQKELEGANFQTLKRDQNHNSKIKGLDRAPGMGKSRPARRRRLLRALRAEGKIPPTTLQPITEDTSTNTNTNQSSLQKALQTSPSSDSKSNSSSNNNNNNNNNHHTNHRNAKSNPRRGPKHKYPLKGNHRYSQVPAVSHHSAPPPHQATYYNTVSSTPPNHYHPTTYVQNYYPPHHVTPPNHHHHPHHHHHHHHQYNSAPYNPYTNHYHTNHRSPAHKSSNKQYYATNRRHPQNNTKQNQPRE